MSFVISVNIAKTIHAGDWTGSEGRTGIDKRPVNHAVRFENNGVAGDSVIDTKVHGGYDKAVYAYALEDTLWWQEQIGKPINHGAFGENLTIQGVDINRSIIGERWRIGSTVLEVSEPRIPCRVFAGFWQRPSLIKEFTDAKRSGTYLRIITEGEIKAGDSIEMIYRPEHQITILDIFSAKAGDREKIVEISQVTELSDKYRQWAKNLI
jgi:MOSC domain-containing protein YiiM